METVTVKIPKELAGKIEKVAKILDFKDVNEFVTTAARRLLDEYIILTKEDCNGSIKPC